MLGAEQRAAAVTLGWTTGAMWDNHEDVRRAAAAASRPAARCSRPPAPRHARPRCSRSPASSPPRASPRASSRWGELLPVFLAAFTFQQPVVLTRLAVSFGAQRLLSAFALLPGGRGGPALDAALADAARCVRRDAHETRCAARLVALRMPRRDAHRDALPASPAAKLRKSEGAGALDGPCVCCFFFLLCVCFCVCETDAATVLGYEEGTWDENIEVLVP